MNADEKLERFIQTLELSLLERSQMCEDFAATPTAILIDVLNAVIAARHSIDPVDESEPTIEEAG